MPGIDPPTTGFVGAMHPRDRARSCTPLLFLALPLVASTAIACGQAADATDDLHADETTAASDDTPAASSGGVETTADEPPATTTGASASEDGADDTGSSSEDGFSFLMRPDGGTAPAGFCLGVSEVGHLATILAAGDTPVDPTCSTTPTQCGGDIVGQWTLQDHCGLETLPNFFASQCPTSTMTYLASSVVGTRAYRDDLTFTHDTVLELDVELALDTMECFGAGCEAFGDALDQQDNNIAAVCAELGDPNACSCSLTITNASTTEGTYVVADQGVVQTVDGASADPLPYCVAEDRLTLWETLNESRVYPDVLCDDAADCLDALGDAHEQWFCLQ